MIFRCLGCGKKFPSEAKRDDHVSSCQPYKEARSQPVEQLTRKEIQARTGVSPSAQRRYENFGLKAGYLIKDENGTIYRNPEIYEIGPLIRLHRKKGR